ncbi:hypothetical protein QBC35DRAFT_108280 [Podospora australis]|uniref:Uncharacterized protein n=1 Tax=Podospora australis TaxID=1536484 RepID=A0AAN6X8Y8_9PEZI|nr:hypothetical protein QBC35DRAFT_108280 [Podospora australis]
MSLLSSILITGVFLCAFQGFMGKGVRTGSLFRFVSSLVCPFFPSFWKCVWAGRRYHSNTKGKKFWL